MTGRALGLSISLCGSHRSVPRSWRLTATARRKSQKWLPKPVLSQGNPSTPLKRRTSSTPRHSIKPSNLQLTPQLVWYGIFAPQCFPDRQLIAFLAVYRPYHPRPSSSLLLPLRLHHLWLDRLGCRWYCLDLLFCHHGGALSALWESTCDTAYREGYP